MLSLRGNFFLTFFINYVVMSAFCHNSFNEDTNHHQYTIEPPLNWILKCCLAKSRHQVSFYFLFLG
jgi:hypothetical protein